MPVIEFDDGKGGKVTAMVCGPRLKSCGWCNRLQSNLCDFPVGNGKTCDASLCDEHATRGGKNLDYCPIHKKAAKQRGLF